EHAALGQAQGVAHGLGQGDLAPLGHGGFHRLAPWMKRYGNMIHTLSSILQPAYFGPTPPPAAYSGRDAKRRRLGTDLTPASQRSPPSPTPSPPAPRSRSPARPTPTPACPGWASASTSPGSRSR